MKKCLRSFLCLLSVMFVVMGFFSCQQETLSGALVEIDLVEDVEAPDSRSDSSDYSHGCKDGAADRAYNNTPYGRNYDSNAGTCYNYGYWDGFLNRSTNYDKCHPVVPVLSVTSLSGSGQSQKATVTNGSGNYQYTWSCGSDTRVTSSNSYYIPYQVWYSGTSHRVYVRVKDLTTGQIASRSKYVFRSPSYSPYGYY